MRTIIKVEHIEKRQQFDVDGNLVKTYWRTHAVLDDGTEAVGYGKDYDLKDKVECFFDEKWGQIKMRRPKLD